MSDVKIKTDDNGEPNPVSISTVNKKIEAFVEILMAKFQQQHERIRSLEQKVQKLEAAAAKKSS